MATAQAAGEPDQRRYARAADGRPYLTCSPHLTEPNRPTKDRWWEDVEPAGPRSILPRLVIRSAGVDISRTEGPHLQNDLLSPP